METIFIGQNCIEVEKTDSTNSYLAELALSSPSPSAKEPLREKERGVFEGTIVVANHQEQGRGQRGTKWASEPNKNITLSILLRPVFMQPDEQFMLNKAISLGVMEFVTSVLTPRCSDWGRPGPSSQTGEWRVRIKWPNDIYIGDKKVAGILIENSVNGNKLQQSIIGIGINVNQEIFSEELPNPVSLKLVSGKEFNLKECISPLCSYLEKRYLQLKANHFERINEDYLKALYRFDEWVNYRCKGQVFKAKITGVAKVGKLLLETEKGNIVECDFKEVEFISR